LETVGNRTCGGKSDGNLRKLVGMCWWRIHAYEDDEARIPKQDLNPSCSSLLHAGDGWGSSDDNITAAGEKATEKTRMMIIENQPSRWESTTDMTVVGYGDTAKRRRKTTTTELGMVVTERQTERRMIYLDSSGAFYDMTSCAAFQG